MTTTKTIDAYNGWELSITKHTVSARSETAIGETLYTTGTPMSLRTIGEQYELQIDEVIRAYCNSSGTPHSHNRLKAAIDHLQP